MTADGKKVILVTGASSGIGNACATFLAKRGCIVYGTSRNPDQAKRKADEFFNAVQMDVTDENSVRSCVQSILAQCGHIDMVICNAGIGIAGPVETTSTESAELQFQTNFFGTFRLIREVLPGMRKNGGKILVMSSMAGKTGIPFQAFYSASKFALEGLVESLRMELKPYPVQICLIEPGDFRTGFTAARKRIPLPEDSPYYKTYTNSLAVMENDERNGAHPILIARLVFKLLQGRNPLRTRYSIGMFFQRFSMVLKRILPDKAFERIFCTYYKID